MDRVKKQEVVSNLKEIFSSSSIVIVCHNNGLTVSQANGLRREVRKAKSTYLVTKNRLAKIAIDGTGFQDLKKHLAGPVSISYSNDPVGISKALAAFAKDNEKLAIIGGVLNGEFLNANAIKQLATLPSLDELRGKIVGLLKASATKLAILTQAPASQIARVISAHATKN